jgi:TonB family protein
MTHRLICCLALVLLTGFALHAQTPQPFASLEQAVNAEQGGWAGDKSKLSAVFDAERRQLGDRFQAELLKWLGQDPERHYWISFFLEADSYLHGNRRLPHLSLLVMEQGLSLVRNKYDKASQGYVVGLSITAATLSAELGFMSLATSHKDEGEELLRRNEDLSAHVPAMTEADRRLYESIPSRVARPTVIHDSNPAPRAQVTGGIVNGKALVLPKPAYPLEARRAGAEGTVEVRIVIDEEGKVIWARAISGHPLLHAASEAAAWKSTFHPLKLSGQPVKVSGVLVYNFVKFP